MQQTFDFSTISDDLLLFKDGSYALVLETTSVNLDLKSEAEADVLIAHYQHFLQSLSASIQILVRTRAVDMDEKYESLQLRINEASSETKRELLEDYREFLSQLVIGRNMLTRTFYVVLSTKGKVDIEQAKEQLLTQKEMLIRSLQQLELKAQQLTSIELAQLFYSSFQPGKAKIQPLIEEILL